MMTDYDALVEVTLGGALAALIAFFIFKERTRSPGPRFKIFPSSNREWIGYWFHTFEFLVCCCVLIANHPAFWLLHSDITFWIVGLALSLPVILLLSAVVFWRDDRSLAKDGLLWAGVACVGFLLIPAIPCTR